ncbi:MAG: penicillin-binding protein activator [Alphaproteobacteria bacterium]|nr:penicillin-binding protein activator [Alphaproteobacteria bacterium]
MVGFRARRAGLAAALFVMVAFLGACSSTLEPLVPTERVESAPAPKPADAPPPSTLDVGQTQPEPGPVVILDRSGPPKVALLVPLTGRATEVGKALRNAAELALFDIADDDFTLAFYDTASSPQMAAEAAQNAIAEGADLIVGPLFSESAKAVAPVARAANVPVLAFSNDRTAAGDGVWILGLLPGEQVERVIRYAAANGFARIGVLAPSNAYGFTVVEAARQSAARAGAAITRTQSYTPGSPSLSETVQRFAATAGDTFPYDAVLVPEGGQSILNVAPLMAYYDIDPKEVKYLGTALWADRALSREPTLLGGWFAAPDPAMRQGFVDRYRAVYGTAPHGLASLSYDAVGLTAVLARQTDDAPFAFENLTQPSGFAGADGLFRLLPDGTNQRGLAVLRVTENGFRSIDPAPQSFSPAIN